MPKLIVLIYGAEGPAATLGESAMEGATSVRFTEVDVRVGSAHEPTTGRHYKVLDAPARLRDYAGVVIAAPSVGDVPSELDALLTTLERLEAPDAFTNTVFAVLGGENTVLLGRVARLGGIIVAEPRGIDDPEARARATGKRVARVVEWVRHALSHEHGRSHSH